MAGGVADMKSFWILGSGHFGSLATKRILQSRRDCKVIVVDHDAESLDVVSDRDVEIIQKDAIDFLLSHNGLGHEWIVPAIPQHVAFAWLCRKLAEDGKVVPLAVPVEFELQVPNPLKGETGSLYTSFATFQCPEDCDEPEMICTVTGKGRQAHLFELLQHMRVPGYEIHVVRSNQLEPGVGGYRLSVLWHLLENVRSADKKIIVSTACSCHGVVNALRFDRSVK
jgi:hypothetical protein